MRPSACYPSPTSVILLLSVLLTICDSLAGGFTAMCFPHSPLWQNAAHSLVVLAHPQQCLATMHRLLPHPRAGPVNHRPGKACGPKITPPSLSDHGRGDDPGPESESHQCHRDAVRRGLLGGGVLWRGALPPLHQPHFPGVLCEPHTPARTSPLAACRQPLSAGLLLLVSS